MKLFQQPEAVGFNLASLGAGAKAENVLNLTVDAGVAADQVLNSGAPALNKGFDI